MGDVAARLAEGRADVEHTQTYVDACRALGYQHPDLTAHGSQVRDWYETEAGLDLAVLDADCAALWAAVNATEEALAIQRAQSVELAAIWRGLGAGSAAQFLQRHCDAATTTAARVRAAAERCSALRNDLWQTVDGKVATAIAVDDRSLSQRSAWLAAAQTVTTGAGDRSAAEETVCQEVVPHVDNDIRIDWLSAMRSAVDAAAAAYDATIDALASAPKACFEIPGDLGPQPPRDAPPVPVAVPPAATIPAAASSPPPSPPPAGMLDGLTSTPPLPDMTAPLGDAAEMSSGAGNLGGLSGLAGNIGGVVGKIIDDIGGLLGSLADGLAGSEGESLPEDPLDLDDDPFDEADEADDTEPDDTEPDENEPDETESGQNEPVDSGQKPDTEKHDENPVPAEDVTNGPATASPAEPPPPPQAQTPPEGETPCEIAADELPQAGQ